MKKYIAFILAWVALMSVLVWIVLDLRRTQEALAHFERILVEQQSQLRAEREVYGTEISKLRRQLCAALDTGRCVEE